jgi:diadenosine tetraphosphate (Ap4A) HIT family hydrolase
MRELSKEQALVELELHKRELLRQPDECVMCALAEQRDAALVLKDDPCGSVVLDRFGNRAGHLLVISKRHTEHVTQLSWHEYSALQRLAYEASQALERVLAPRRVYIAALGSSEALPMTFSHFHLHVVPVLEDDERPRPAQVFSWSEGVVTYEPEQAQELVSGLRRAWPDR